METKLLKQISVLTAISIFLLMIASYFCFCWYITNDVKNDAMKLLDKRITELAIAKYLIEKHDLTYEYKCLKEEYLINKDNGKDRAEQIIANIEKVKNHDND